MNVQVKLINTEAAVNANIVNANAIVNVSNVSANIKASAIANHNSTKANTKIINSALNANCTIVLTIRNYLYVLPQDNMQWITQDNPLYYYIKSNTNWNIN